MDRYHGLVSHNMWAVRWIKSTGARRCSLSWKMWIEYARWETWLKTRNNIHVTLTQSITRQLEHDLWQLVRVERCVVVSPLNNSSVCELWTVQSADLDPLYSFKILWSDDAVDGLHFTRHAWSSGRWCAMRVRNVAAERRAVELMQNAANFQFKPVHTAA